MAISGYVAAFTVASRVRRLWIEANINANIWGTNIIQPYRYTKFSSRYRSYILQLYKLYMKVLNLNPAVKKAIVLLLPRTDIKVLKDALLAC